MSPEFFGLQTAPFGMVPKVDLYFANAHQEQVRQSCGRCIERAEGIAVIIGAPGTGKTLLTEVLAGDLDKDFATVILGGGQFTTRRALLQAILYELKLPCTGRDEGDLRLTLLDRLSEPDDPGIVILCDEAHALPTRLLEELRLLTNVVRNGQSKVRLILVGNTHLEERLTSPKLEALNQRVTQRCYLQHWNRGETREYVRSQIYLAGGVPEQLFTNAALDAIYRATDGVPRLINQICDHALIMAAEAGRHQLDKNEIEAAWADLQQLPMPVTTSATSTTESAKSVVEFGTFDETPSALSNTDDDDTSITVQHAASTTTGPRLFASDDTDDLEEEGELTINDQAEFTELDLPEVPSFRPRVALTDEPEETLTDDEVEQIDAIVPRMLHDLQQVEQNLSTLQQDFAELGIGNEYELSWPGADPFAEAFLEEEVVLDPFLNQSMNIFENRPVVQTVESKNIATELKKSCATNKASGKPCAQSCKVATAGQTTVAVPCSTSSSIELVYAQAMPVLPKPAPQSPVATTTDVDDDLIVIEDEVASQAPPQPRATRQDYSQLFARLRKG
jgi:type II secretory pathway predicted ATPase ExeA